jgi:peroxiredoxin Q/BCP
MLSALLSRPLPPGTPAPDFTLPDHNGRMVSLAGLRGRNVVLVFYPGDDTPGCRKQLCEFRDNWSSAQSRNAVVFGVNPQNASSHGRFIEKFGFPFALLVDAGQRVAKLYNASVLIVRRTVYLIGPDGNIRYSKRGSPPPSEVLAAAVEA